MKRIVTDKELESKSENGVFRVERDMILTPSARDFALKKGIRLEYPSEHSGTGVPSPDEDALTAAIREIVAAELGHLDGELETVISQEVHNHLGTQPSTESPMSDSVAEAVTSVLSAKHRTAEKKAQAVITVAGENNPGIVAEVSRVLGEMGTNIVDISQTVVGRYFTMILVVDIQHLEASGTGFSSFRETVQRAARDAGVAANVMHENILTTMHRVV